MPQPATMSVATGYAQVAMRQVRIDLKRQDHQSGPRSQLSCIASSRFTIGGVSACLIWT